MYLITALIIILFSPDPPAFGIGPAAGTDPHHYQIQATQAVTIPYEFAPLTLDSPDAEPLPAVDFTDTDWINYVGSIGLTVVALFDEYRFLAIMVIIMVSIGLLFALWTFVTDTPGRVSLKFTDAANLGADMIDQQADYYEERAVDYENRSRRAGGEFLGAEADRYRGQASNNRRLSGGLRGGARSIRRAKNDFRNPFK